MHALTPFKHSRSPFETLKLNRYGSPEFLDTWVDWVDGDLGVLSSGEWLAGVTASGSDSEGEGSGGGGRVLVVGGHPAMARV